MLEPEPVVEPEPEAIFEPEPLIELEDHSHPVPEEDVQDGPDHGSPLLKALKVILIICAVLAILLGLYIAVAKLAPEWLDRLLYTKVQLEILNYKP